MGQSPSIPSPGTAPASTKNQEMPSSCPVDHKSREAWLRAAEQRPTTPGSALSPSQLAHETLKTSTPPKATPPSPKITNARLSTEREVSTIPRAAQIASTPTSQPAPASASHASSSPNAQTADPHTSATGTWVYPSEAMFFEAMARKNYSPREADMSSVVPIHNAVNERTWQEILQWERAADPSSRLRCGGPKLVSFQGDSSKLTPRARWNALIGYERPFDRHDWVVDRCGVRVEYVIDYYAGKQRGDVEGKSVSFYLDVRPKLNSWEGLRMRVGRAVGLSWPVKEA